jgi:hypothetical protein
MRLRCASLLTGYAICRPLELRHGWGVYEVLEHGDVQFFYRPTVQPADAERFTLGVQSLFLILSPANRRIHRRLRIGKKRMPARPRDRFWARVERVGSLQRVLGDELEPDVYVTKTRGERYQPAARPIALGTYELVRHEDHVHLRYRAERVEFVELPEELQLPESGDHLVLFKRIPTGRAIWTHEGNVAQLDHEDAQIVLVGGAPHPDERAQVAS